MLVPIGEFSKMTYLSVKALRHYHDVGLLEPAAVEPDSGYRMYSPAQVPVAQAIRRFRDLDMPLEDIRRVLEAPDVAARNAAIVEHLERMREQLSADAGHGGVAPGAAHRHAGDGRGRAAVRAGHDGAGDQGDGVRRGLRRLARRRSRRAARRADRGRR